MPECGRKLTVGVLHRVEKLADRGEGEAAPERRFEYLIPLEEVIGSALGVGPNSKKVQRIYHALVESLGPELDVLRTADTAKIAQSSGQPLVAEGVRRMRNGKVRIAPGYDGEYGRIEVFSDEERSRIEGQSHLFDMGAVFDEESLQAAEAVESMAGEDGGTRVGTLLEQGGAVLERLLFSGTALDPEQQAAVEEPAGPVVVAAGPGSGKTRTLVQRIAHLVRREGVSPGKIHAVTFTNRAADEMRQRLRAIDPPLPNVERVFTGTFHRLALQLMGTFRRGPEPAVIDGQDGRAIVAAVIEEQGAGIRPAAAQEQISRWKAEGRLPGDAAASEAGLASVYEGYQQRLARLGARDYDDILLDFLHLLEEDEGFSAYAAGCIQCLLIDEFQDLNAVQYRLVVRLAGDGRGPLRHRRPQPVDLRLPRRRPGVLRPPRLRFFGKQTLPPDNQLPLCAVPGAGGPLPDRPPRGSRRQRDVRRGGTGCNPHGRDEQRDVGGGRRSQGDQPPRRGRRHGRFRQRGGKRGGVRLRRRRSVVPHRPAG